jgi:outer membrane usher protein
LEAERPSSSKRNRRIKQALVLLLLLLVISCATAILLRPPAQREAVAVDVRLRPSAIDTDMRLDVPKLRLDPEHRSELVPPAFRSSAGPLGDSGRPENSASTDPAPPQLATDLQSSVPALRLDPELRSDLVPPALRGSAGPAIDPGTTEDIATSDAAPPTLAQEVARPAPRTPELRASVAPTGPRAQARRQSPARSQDEMKQDRGKTSGSDETPISAAPAPDSAPDVAGPTPLQLEVTINGRPSQLIGTFLQMPDGEIAATRGELTALGLKMPEGAIEDVLRLSDIPQLRYTYDAPGQRIAISQVDIQGVPQILNLRPSVDYRPPRRTTGAFLNYIAFLSGASRSASNTGWVNGGSLNLDGHLFSRIGTFSQSGIVGTTSFDDATVLRLDSYWSYSNPETRRSSRAGDLITGGLAWTRPVRIAGLQTRRNFGLRPDLITLPLPSLSGSAAVPSTVDVYLGQVKAYSAEVPSGPYRLDNIPVVSGGGTARVVVTDSTGRQVQSETALFTDIRLLSAGLVDYSVEAGFQRLNYGVRSSDYEDEPVVTASIRTGLTDHVTLEGHTEIGRGLWNAGAGVSFSAGGIGLLSGAGSFSSSGLSTGALLYGAWDLPNGNFNLHASTQRTIGDYQDLASLPLSGVGPGTPFPLAIDQITASYRFPNSQSSVSFGAVHADQGLTGTSTVLTASFTRSFTNGMSLFASAYHDVDNSDATGAFLGLSIPLGGSWSSFAGVTQNNRGLSVSADIAKAVGTEPGSTGGRLAVSQGETSYVSAYGALRLNRGFLEGAVTHQSDSTNAYVTFSGALVAAGNGVFASQRIDDAFAVVNAGAPGVKVLRENQPVGVTDSSGRLLVPGLNSYQPYKISIDPLDLPITADVPETEVYVVPAERSGVVASFGIQRSLPSAEVIFVGADGFFLAPGSPGVLQGSGESFIVGYDGRAFIKNLSPQNTVTIDLETAPCKASFAFEAKPDALVTIGPVTCQ